MNDNEEWGEIEPVEAADDFGEVEPLSWEDGDGGNERLPDGEKNQWGGNLRNEGRRVLLRRDKDEKVNGYSTTSSMLVRHDDGKFAVVPTVVGGKELSQEDAVRHYAETGEHWGMADDEDSAQKMAQEVHEAHLKDNQAKWNDWLHGHWDDVSDEIRRDRGVAYEHKRRTEPDKITLMERLANGDTADAVAEWKRGTDESDEMAYNTMGQPIGRKRVPRKEKSDEDALAGVAKEAGLEDWQIERIRKESKSPEEMRGALAYVAGNRVGNGERTGKSAGWRSVPRTVVNTAGKMAAGLINLVGTAAGGVDEDARHAFMADDPMAKKEGESFDAWLGRVNIDEKVKRMAKRDSSVRESLEKYFRWEAPIAGKEGMRQEHSLMVENGREGTAVGNAAIRDAKRLRNWLDEKTPVGNSGNAVVDWLEGAASGIAQFAYLGPTMIAMSSADAYQQTRSTALESGKTGKAAEGLAGGSALFDGTMTAAFYYAPFRRWMNGKGIVPVQPVEKFTFGGLSKAMGRFNAKREFLNQGVAALEAGGLMGAQGVGDTAFRQLASGHDLDLGEITIEGLKGVRDGVAIGAIMGAGRVLNARVKGTRDYEKVVREAAKMPEGRLLLARLNPDGMMALKRFVQEGIDTARAHAKPTADFEAGMTGEAAKGRTPSPDWKPTKEAVRKFQELCDKAGLPPDAKLATDILFDPRVANFLGDTLNAKFRDAANAQPERAAIPEKPTIDAETGKVVTPSQELARKMKSEFGVEPVNFSLPQTADGKPGLVPMKWRDNRTGKENVSNLAHDPNTGVTIMEETDGTFSVHNDTGDSDGAATLGEAIEKARELALMGQYTALDRQRKRQVIENERAAKYGKKNVVYFNTMADAAQAFADGIARDGSCLGLNDAGQLLNPAVQDRDAFYTPDGTAVVILDNVQEVGDIPRILAHEIVGHGGPNGEFGKSGAVEFAENIRAREFDAFKRQIVDGLFPATRGTMEGVNRNLAEVFAHYASANLDAEPSKLDRLVSKVNDAARKLNLRKTYSSADVKVMMKRWREAAKGEGGVAAGRADTPERFEFFPVEERKETNTEVKDETGNGTDEAQPVEKAGMDGRAKGQEVQRNEAAAAAGAETAKPDVGAPAAEVPPVMRTEHDFLRVMHDNQEPVRVPVGDVSLPDTQFKEGADPKTGVVKGQELKGEYFESAENAVVVYVRKDGTKELVTGRHRFDLAKRTGKKDILARLFYEKDGYTPEDMRNLDAISNIIDEKGSVKDYVRYFENAKPSRAAAESAGFLSRSKGRLAFELYEGATEGTRAAVDWSGSGADGLISVEQAGIIAKAAPRNAHPRNGAVQKILVKKALEGLRGDRLAIVARSLSEEAKSRKAPATGGEMQLDLFTSEEDLRLLALEEKRAAKRVEKANEYGRIANVLQTAMQKGGRLDLNKAYAKELGIRNPKDRKQLADARQKALEKAEYWRNAVRLDETDRAALDAELGIAPKENLELERVTGDQIAEENRKRAEKEEIERRKAAPLKGGAGEVGQSLMDLGGAEGEDLFNRTQRPEPVAEKSAEPARPVKGAQATASKAEAAEKPAPAMPTPETTTLLETEKERYIAFQGAHNAFDKVFREAKGDLSASSVQPFVEELKAVIAASPTKELQRRDKSLKRIDTGREDDSYHHVRQMIAEELKRRENGPVSAPKESGATTTSPRAAKPAEGRESGDAAVLKEALTAETPAKPVAGGKMPKTLMVGGVPIEDAHRKVTVTTIDENGKPVTRRITPEEAEKMGVQMTATLKPTTSQESRQVAKSKMPKAPSVRMKDEAAERKAKAALDAIDFDTPELGVGSTIVSGDEVRKTMPGYNRLDWSTHVDRTGYVGPRLEAQFQRLLKERKGKGDGTVVFLAGGNGAGKSTVAAKIGDSHDFTIDSTLGNLDVAKRQIDAILANGQTPEIHFVYRTPGQALEGIAQRIRNGGHIVSPLSFANSHVKSRENLRLLSDAYGDKIRLHIYDNSVEGAPEITLKQLEAKGKPDHARIRESANYFLGHLREREEASGRSKGGVAGGDAKGARGQVDFDTSELGIREKQTALSGGTSRNQNPSGNEYGKKWRIFRSGTRNVDIGAGRFDKATRFLADIGVENIPFDPVNCDSETNRRAAESVRANPADTATVHNVLNVIDNDAVMEGIVNQAARAIKQDGSAIFTIYEGNRSGVGTRTRDGYQRNAKVRSYETAIKKFFGSVETHGNVILAKRPKDTGPAFWAFDSSFENGIDFDTPDFNPEKFGKLVTGVGKLVDVLVENGHRDFKALATYIQERDAAKYERAKPVIQDIWNAVARARGLARVGDTDAERIFGIIEAQAKEVNDGADRRGQHGVDAAEPASDGGGERSRGILAGGRVRPENPDARVDGGRPGALSGQHEGLAGKGTAEGVRRGDSGRAAVKGNESVGDRGGSKDGERETGRDRAGDGNQGGVSHVKKRAAKVADETKPNPPRRDFVMTKPVEDAILEKKTAQRVRNNLDAIRLIRDLKARDYAATPDEQATLAKFVGWGGLREDVFSYGLESAYTLERAGEPERVPGVLRKYGISQGAYELHRELRQLLNDKEYESAKASASTAFYTPVYFVRALHDNLRRLGVKGGRFLGPSAGTGNFASAAGEYEKPVNWQFVEKDVLTGEMLKALFPNQRVSIGGFEDTKFPDGFFDFAIDNVPYADVPINDRSLSSRMFKVHDYFFAKTLAKLRPGGVMAFLTSTGTLDKTSPILRQFLTEHGGQIVGAVRLPNGFFSENAGTDVASDLVIVQKVQGRPDNAAFEKGVEYGKTEEWVRRKGRIEKPLTYNGYFQDHPEQVVGTMEIASGQFGPTLKYTMPDVPPGDLSSEIGKAIGRALDGIDKDTLLKSAAVAERQDHTPVYDAEGLRQGSVTMKDGKPFIKSGEMLEPIAFPNDRSLSKELKKRGRTPDRIMGGLLSLRKAMRDVIDAQMADNDAVETDLAPLQAKLNEAYDTFVKANGTLHDKWISPFVLLDKADGNRLLALERIVKDESGKPKVVKSDIFTKRVISRGQRATKADTPKDALVISYSESGAINVPRIAELLGVGDEEAVRKLKEGGDAFENPQTGLLEPSWEYLSGRVRAKLAAARAAVEAGEEAYRANVEALEKVQPPMVRLEDAEIKFGATWVDTDCMKDFLRDAFGSESMHIMLGRNEVTGQWNVEFGRIMNEDPWGETSWSPQEFVSRVLNHGSMNHYETDPVDKKRYLNEKRTEGNKLAAEKLHHAFSQFIQASERWAEPMYERYNAVMTDMVEIKLPNNILPFRAAGMSEAALGKLFEGGDPKKPKKGREYQSGVIARGVLGGSSLCLAHCVGAGKTLEMQSIGVLGRHLGQFKKPMYVVPNHMLEQFTNEFVEAFPNANILKMAEADVKPENRRAFFAQVANGDWDAIVVKHSTFSKKLAMSDEYQKEFMESQRRDLIEAIAAMRDAGERISVDQATKKLERLEAKLEQLANAENHDSQIVPFEELGVDQLFVDEAHNFKGMPITTRQGRTGGLSQGDSQRAVDMEMKTQYVQSLHGGDRGVVFATGTPLSNAPVVEAYVMLKYLAANKLEEQGLKHFDDFVDAFGRITTESEFSLDGKTVKEKEKVSAFVNIPELMKLLRSVVDIVNPDQLDIPRPKPKYHMIDVDMSPVQERIMEMVAHEAATPPSREERNKYLTLTRIAKNACLTPRLLGFEDGGNKIIRAVSEIKKVYDETAAERGAQLVFTDIFNRAGGGTDEYIAAHITGGQDMSYARGAYNLNEEIRNLLVTAGIPRDEIAIIQDIDKSKGDKDANKSALFAKVRSGEVRVLIGSRPKMGEGTNVQERLAAIHLLHPGWKPSEDEQAIGRIIRFGNTYKEGQIFYYLTKGNANIGSYETKNHQLIGVKSKLIDQVMHGDDSVREIDMDESAMDRDMLMGLASGNKALMELIDVKKRVHKLELNTESVLSSARRNKDRAEANSRILARRREEFAREQEGVKEWRKKNEGKPFVLSTPDGRSIEKVKDMADYVSAQMAKQLTKDRYGRDDKTVLGDFNGVELVLAYDKWGDEKFSIAVPMIGVAREINYSGFLPDFSQAAMTAFKGKIFETVSPDFAKAYENSLADMDRQAKKMSADADRLQKDYEGMRDELVKLRTRQAELERAVTPLVIQAVENRKVAAYGNWLITKSGNGQKYVARRESDAKSLSAPTVKELIPLMDAEDFARPKNAATKTADLRPHLKPNSKGEYPSVDTLSVGQVDFDTPNLTPAEEKYSEAEDKAPTEQVMREVYGMTNDEIATALKAAGMEPPKHVRKPDETAWKQTEALLSNPSYMAKLSRAVAKFPRNIADYENNALNVLFRRRQAAVNAAQSVVNSRKEALDALNAIPKAERDVGFGESLKEAKSEYGDAMSQLAQAKSLMYETGLALTRSSSEAGRRLRANRGLIDQTDFSYAGISGQVAAILGGADKITPEMDAKIREIASGFATLDEEGRDLATARLKAQAEKIVEQIKRGDRIRKVAERNPGDEVKRVMRNYNDALAQIEVGSAEVGGTLVGLSDQQYPAWGKWLRAIGEYHCFENPDITEDECIKAIVEDISPFMDGVDENQVRDALTGFGHNFRQSRYEAQRLMNDLRSQSRLKRQMDWMDENNTMPPLTGMVRDEPSNTTRNLQKQVQERKKEVPDAGRDARRLKGVLESAKTRVKNRIADLEHAIETGEKIPGRERMVMEDIELRELRKQKDELQKTYDELFRTEHGITDAQRVKLAERLLGRELEHALADLDRARSGDFSKRARRPRAESSTLDVLRERLSEVRGQIRELKKAKYEFGMTPEELSAYNARKMANREKAIARLAERIVRGDLRPQKKPQPPMPPEMQKRYEAMAEQMNRAHRKLADLRREAADARKPKFVRFMGDAYRFVDGVWKMATASLDFTQVGNQTGTILMAHPKIVAANFAKTISAFKSRIDAENIELDLLSDASVKEAVDNGWLRWKKVSDSTSRGERVELFDAIDKPFTIGGKAIRLTDIPFYGTAIENSDRLYATYINAVSASLYSTIVNDPKLFPGGATVFQKKMLCDMINVMNGSGTLSKDNRRMLGKVFWAPGLVDSQLKRLIGYQVWHPWTASAEEDGSGTFKERLAMSRIGLGEFVRSNLGAILLGSLLMALFSTDDQKDEFAHAGLVKRLQMLVAPRIRHTQLDLTGGSVAFLRLGIRLVTGAYETATGKQAKVRDMFGEVAHFAKGRLTPLVSNAFSALSGKDYTGQDYGAAELLLSFAPISLRDAGHSIYENGIEDRAWATAFLGAGLTMFGIGKGTYRKDDYAILSNRFLDSQREYDAIEKDELLDEQNRRLLLDSIVAENPLMREGVREDIAADIAQIRRDEARASRDEKEGHEVDASLLADIERGKAKLIEKIRAERRK